MLRALLLISLLLASSVALSQGTPSVSSAEPHSDSPPANGRQVDTTNSAAQPTSDSLVIARSIPVTYPAAAKQTNTQGYVVVKITVNENGDVEEVENVSGDPALAAAAADGIRQWKFKPFIKDGKSVKVSTKVEFRFAIADGKCTNGVKEATVTTAFERKLTVSEGEMQKFVCKKVVPVKSHLAELASVGGDVVMEVMVGKDGTVQSLRVLGNPSPLLAPSALEAAKQWRYRPYVVLGEPVPVLTTIKFTFSFLH